VDQVDTLIKFGKILIIITQLTVKDSKKEEVIDIFSQNRRLKNVSFKFGRVHSGESRGNLQILPILNQF
jgi:hypothetical protein